MAGREGLHAAQQASRTPRAPRGLTAQQDSLQASVPRSQSRAAYALHKSHLQRPLNVGSLPDPGLYAVTIVGARRLDVYCLHIQTTAAATAAARAAAAMAAVKLLGCGFCTAGIPWCPARAKVWWQAAMQASVAVVFKVMQGFLDVHAPGVLRHLEQQPAEVVKLRALRQRDRDRFTCQINAC